MYIRSLKNGQYCVMPDMYIGTYAQCMDYVNLKK